MRSNKLGTKNRWRIVAFFLFLVILTPPDFFNFDNEQWFSQGLSSKIGPSLIFTSNSAFFLNHEKIQEDPQQEALRNKLIRLALVRDVSLQETFLLNGNSFFSAQSVSILLQNHIRRC